MSKQSERAHIREGKSMKILLIASDEISSGICDEISSGIYDIASKTFGKFVQGSKLPALRHFINRFLNSLKCIGFLIRVIPHYKTDHIFL